MNTQFPSDKRWISQTTQDGSATPHTHLDNRVPDSKRRIPNARVRLRCREVCQGTRKKHQRIRMHANIPLGASRSGPHKERSPTASQPRRDTSSNAMRVAHYSSTETLEQALQRFQNCLHSRVLAWLPFWRQWNTSAGLPAAPACIDFSHHVHHH